MWNLSDESLLVGLGSGDPDAAAAFVRRFQRRVFGLTMMILRDAGAAEDAAQETFVRAWRHAGAYDSRRGTVAAWLLKIARNVSINMLPTRRAEPVEPHELAALATPNPALDGDASEWTAEVEPLRRALDRLPLDQRRAVVLAAYYGFTAREVGELDGVPVGTAKTRIRAGLMKLRAELVLDER